MQGPKEGMGREALTLVEDPAEESGERTLLFSRLAQDDHWQWLEPGGQASVLHRLAAALDEVLTTRGVCKRDPTTDRADPTCEKYEGLRHEGILVVSKATGATDDEGNTGADVLMAVALDFIAAARRVRTLPPSRWLFVGPGPAFMNLVKTRSFELLWLYGTSAQASGIAAPVLSRMLASDVFKSESMSSSKTVGWHVIHL